MGTGSPPWIPGEAGERLDEIVTGLYGDLPAGVGPLLRLSAAHVARAFDAFARGDWELCDALLAEGLAAADGIFTGLAERVTSPAYPYRVDSPHWVPFLAHLAFMVLDPPPEAEPPAAAPPAEPVSLADEMRAMGWM